MTAYTWNGGGGSFQLGGNWTPAGPPGQGDTANFTNTGGTINGTGTVATVNMNPGASWTFTGSTAANFFNVNDATTISGPGVWTLTGSTSSGDYIRIANGAGTTGSLTLSGGGKLDSKASPNTAAYALYVGGGNSATGANGTMTVTDVGTSVNTGPNGAAVGETGTGTLDVEAGATATLATPNSAIISALAVGRAGNGTVKVSGTGSSLTAQGYVYVGRQGTGTLTVDKGASFTGGSAASGSTQSYGISIGDGSPTLDSTGAPNNPVYFGGTSTATVTGGSTLHSLGNLLVGYRGSAGNLLVDSGGTATSDRTVTIGGGTDRPGAKGTATIQGGGTLKAGGQHATGTAGIVLGNDAGTSGTATVTGAGSTLDANGDRLTIGGNGSGTLTISGGAKALSGSAGYSDVEAALAVAGAAGATGSVTITGAGSQLTASGDAVIGGNEKGAGPTAGGAGTVTVTGGGKLQTGAMTIKAGSSLTVDQASTLSAPSITIDGGSADLATLTTATAIAFGAGGTLAVHAVNGANTVKDFAVGDSIDLVGNASATVAGNRITTSTGTIDLTGAGTGYKAASDGHGGTVVALTPATIGVYRFFDSNFGTHFYTADATEAASVRASRPDLVPEGPGGIGLQAVAAGSGDPNAAPVYRFFDTVHGTHFFTASASERDQIIAGRSDLTYEASSTFYEHTKQQAGDVPVYRFFDNVYGTHFYTDSESERGSIVSTRSDLVAEGVGFYEPPKNAALAA